KLVEAEGVDAPVPEIDANEAQDLIKALAAAGVDGPVDAAAISRGSIRLVIAMRQHPELFRDVFLAHPAGQDDRGSTEAHLDVARGTLAHAYRKMTGQVEHHRPKNVAVPRGRGPLNDPKGWRTEQ